ncbi:MAG TPA: hypothetical protein VMH05_20050 [Bryobacteraceae bacterium]|nr:hypothetical protein [Bryobacteraceae bacterium]
MEIVSFWNRCQLTERPFAHPEDREALGKYGGDLLTLDSLDFAAFIGSKRFNREHDQHFHLSLVPVPYTGSIAKADIFVLNLNPGVNPADYHAEYCVPDFRQQIEANLRQESLNAEFPFLYLNPQFCWHSGFAWWESKFREIATLLAKTRALSYYQSLSELSKRIAAVELFPYHSATFPYGKRMKRELPSSHCARKFVTDTIIPRAARGEAIVILTRGFQDWKLPAEQIVKCPNPQNVTFSSRSPSGKAILTQLGVDLKSVQAASA